MVAGSAKKSVLNSTLISLNELRPDTFQFKEEIEKVTYLKTKRELAQKQRKRVLSLLESGKIINYLKSNVEKKAIKNYLIGEYRNENLKDGFRLKTKGGTTFYLYTGRPQIYKPILRMWNSLSKEVIELHFDNWEELKKLEQNFR